MLHPGNYFFRAFIDIFSRGAICFHRQAKQFELNFFITKIILQMAKPSGLVLHETSAGEWYSHILGWHRMLHCAVM